MPITFDQVMAFHPDNEFVFEDILNSIDQLLPFVGAGLTAPVYGTWTSVIKSLGSKFASSTLRDELDRLASIDSLMAAQFLEDNRGQAILEADLIRYFSREKLSNSWDAIMNGAIWLLPDLFQRPILTTNFDEAIETVFESRGFTTYPVLDPTSPGLRERAIRLMGQPCVFKLHGTVSDRMTDYSRLVFTQRQYDEHYAAGKPIREALERFTSSKAAFFLGCSLRSDRTVSILQEIAGPGITHYAIASLDGCDPDDRVRELANAGIHAIVYDNSTDNCHDSVRTVLEMLLESVRAKS